MAVVNLLDLMTSDPRPNPVALAIKRIDGGPEITTNQLMQIASTVRPK